jgi:very-short-patch-repair endonuclease
VLPYKKELKQLARQLRENMTNAEKCLWEKIRRGQIKGHQFFRQKPLGEYIVDFYCKGAKLVIEIDGSHHFIGENIEYDRIRDDYLSSLGLRVMRFSNTEVLRNIEGVLGSIYAEIPLGWERKSPLVPLKRGRLVRKSPLVPLERGKVKKRGKGRLSLQNMKKGVPERGVSPSP